MSRFIMENAPNDNDEELSMGQFSLTPENISTNKPTKIGRFEMTNASNSDSNDEVKVSSQPEATWTMIRDPNTRKVSFIHPFWGKTNRLPAGIPVKSYPVRINRPKMGNRLTLKPKTRAQQIQNRLHAIPTSQISLNAPYVAKAKQKQINNFTTYRINQAVSNQQSQQSKEEAEQSMKDWMMFNKQSENKRNPEDRANLIKKSYNRVAQSKRQNAGKRSTRRLHSKKKHSSRKLRRSTR